ncbi:MAG: zf-TFIIB domain-containing protein [Deltaproteobacteria bacterium]|nr:zf-TFIIB domain-containing protein [Deltaproteobacteria bacterium]
MSQTVKPSHEEEEYFAKVEIQKKRDLAEKVKKEKSQQELEELKKLHWRHCANCGFEMHPIVFKGVTIDQCPNCGGVFLDPGELKQLAGEEESLFGRFVDVFRF